MRNLVPILAGLVAIAAIGCTKSIDLAAEHAAIRRLDAGLLKDTQERNLEGFLSVYAQDVSVFVPNTPLVTGRDAIRPYWEQLYANPGFDLDWELIDIDVSAGGDLAYSAGLYTLTTQNEKGKLRTDKGKFVAIWKKDSNGHWTQIVDIWNSNEPGS